MRIRTSLLALSLLLPAAVQAGGNLRWTLGSPTGFSFSQGPVGTMRSPGLRPRAPAGTLIPVVQVGRVGGPTIHFDRPQVYVTPGGSQFFRRQLGDTIQQSVRQQCQVVRGSHGRQRRRQFRGVRNHGVGATSSGFRFPLGR